MAARRQARLDLALLSAAWVIAFGLRLLWDQEGALHWEESLQPSAAMLLLDDISPARLLRLQYTTWCGGCSAETLLFLPLAWLSDGALIAWKLVPLGFGLGILALVVSLARAAAGRWAALATGTVLVLAPSYYQTIRLHGWGNHFESALFVLALLGLWLAWQRAPGVWRAVILGLCAGVGFWFCYTSAFVLPVLAVLALVTRPRQLLRHLTPALGGLALGLLPWLLSQRALRAMGVIAKDQPWLSLYGEGVGGNLTPLSALATRMSDSAGPTFWRLSVHPDLGGSATAVGLVVWLAFVLALLLAAARGARWLARRDPQDVVGMLSAAVAALVLVYQGILWTVTPVLCTRDGFGDAISLRYSTPTVPLLALGVGLAVVWLWQRRGPWIGGALLLLLITAGSGVLDLGLTLRHDSASGRVLRLSASQPSSPHCGRVKAPEIPDGLEPRAVLDQAAAQAPGGAAARRMWFFRLGHGLGYSVIRGAPEGWATAVPSLGLQDRAAFLEGVACTVMRARGLEALEGVPTSAPVTAARPLLAALDAEAGAELSEGILAQAITDSIAMEGRILALDLHAIARDVHPQHPGFALGLTRWRARLEARQRAVDSPQLLALAAEAPRDLPAELHAAYLFGLGCEAGDRWGHSAAMVQPILDAAGPSLRQGLRRCAQQRYRWPAVSAGDARGQGDGG